MLSLKPVGAAGFVPPARRKTARTREVARGASAARWPLWALLLMAIGSRFAFGEEPPPADPPSSLPAAAYLHDGTLYHLRPWIEEQIREACKRGDPLKLRMWTAPLTPAGAVAGDVKRYPSDHALFGIPYHWRIFQDRFWGSGDCMESTSVDVYGFFRCSLSDLTTCREKSYVFDPLLALHDYTLGAREAKANDAPWEEGHFDFLPGEHGEIAVLFAWRGELRVWRGRMREPDPRRYPTIDWERTIEPRSKEEEEEVDHLRKEEHLGYRGWNPIRSRPVLRLRCELREPFQVYQDADHFFFATVSGELHALHKRAERPRLWKVWGDSRRPLAALLTNTASGKTFAFTASCGRARPEAPDVYFELSGQVSPIPFDRARIPADSEQDPLSRMMGYARVLLHDRKVALKD
jgi:hypothetical protein